ncbi:PEP-CTERM sorting domain-containing protein [Janthinobacterium sp. RB2P8]|uniref:PEP-CTERM sorting domain-containing protein n=1 Tax=Janthinobacterium sp. RB2P8 TaxID=3424191 RepID=UPI003F288436
MKIFQPLCVAMLALSASAGNAAATGAGMPGNPHAARDQVVSDESLVFNNSSNHLGWETPDLPYARLLTQGNTLNAAPRWRSAGARQGALSPPAVVTAPAVQQANVPPPVPEASTVSMLLVGLGLLAFSMYREKQEKFDS